MLFVGSKKWASQAPQPAVQHALLAAKAFEQSGHLVQVAQAEVAQAEVRHFTAPGGWEKPSNMENQGVKFLVIF